MNDPSTYGIHLTKDYYKEFVPTDLQWTVTEVSDDFTLYDLFHLVHHANSIIPGISTTMGASNFEAFWKQIQLDRDVDDKDDVEYLQLYWHPSYDTRVVKKTGKLIDQPESDPTIEDGNNYWDDPKVCELPNLMSFHGIGPHCYVNYSNSKDYSNPHICDEDDRCLKKSGYAIEFTPVNNLKHLPIHVLPKVEFFPPYVESDCDFHRTGFELTIEPTLWCFITSIFWELTFAGSNPDEVADQAREIFDRVDEAKEHYDKMEKLDE